MGFAKHLTLITVLAASGSCTERRMLGPAPPDPITTVTFNIAGTTIEDPIAGPSIVAQLSRGDPDFMLLQECLCDKLAPMLPSNYKLTKGSEGSEVGIAYDAQKWLEIDTGVLELGNDDGWGKRLARWSWMQLSGGDSKIHVYSTHFCVPIRNDQDACDTGRQLAYAEQIVRDIDERSGAAIFGGDLNVFDGFASGPVVEFFRSHGLIDTLSAVTSDNPDTFEGNDWAPPGRIDYIFASQPARVEAASVAETSASDHRPVTSTVDFD
jgi:endonuclease/exonuclease/phosphatase family metal-dependent hydrolase